MNIQERMTVECASVSFFWNERIRHFNAIPRKYGSENTEQRDKSIYFETTNFGWILSPIDPATGTRKVLLQY
jgi:hypothetical protein